MALTDLKQVGNLVQRKLAELAEPGSSETLETDQARDDLAILVSVWDFVTGAHGKMGRNEKAHQMLLEAINRTVPLQSLDQVTVALMQMMAEKETDIRLAMAEWVPNVEGNVGGINTPKQQQLLMQAINEAAALQPAAVVTVSELFARDFPDLASFLDNPGSFWPKVRDNKIANIELAYVIKIAGAGYDFSSKVYKAAIQLMIYRLKGVLPNPG